MYAAIEQQSIQLEKKKKEEKRQQQAIEEKTKKIITSALEGLSPREIANLSEEDMLAFLSACAECTEYAQQNIEKTKSGFTALKKEV